MSNLWGEAWEPPLTQKEKDMLLSSKEEVCSECGLVKPKTGECCE